MGVPPLNDVLQSFEMNRMSWGNWSNHLNDAGVGPGAEIILTWTVQYFFAVLTRSS